MKLRYKLIVAAAVAAAISAVGLRLWPEFGGSLSGERLARAQASPQYKDGGFENVVPRSPREAGQLWAYAKRQFAGTEARHPPGPIPVAPLSPDIFKDRPAPGLRAVWFGHATVYVEIDGIRVMVDPILSDYASPFAGIGPKRFHPPPLAMSALPKVDAVIISHDHYDHLDMSTIKQLQKAGSHFFVPLGIGAHLERWGVPRAQFTELDWWQSADVGGVKVTSTPVRHYSGRSLGDQNATLWSSWVVAGPRHSFYFSGDTGAGDHFATIGQRLGPFDLSVVKIGAYGPGKTWTDIHMTPEDAVAAHVALKARRMLPVHWATFNLAFHDWDEPIKRTVAAAQQSKVDLVTPRIGEVVTLDPPFVSSAWWTTVR
jgi:L-ascorbate metabolism protein UlaG (beta-lactamase superfamily)